MRLRWVRTYVRTDTSTVRTVDVDTDATTRGKKGMEKNTEDDSTATLESRIDPPRHFENDQATTSLQHI